MTERVALPTDVVPIKYTLKYDIGELSVNSAFQGEEVIDVKLLRDTNDVVLHSLNLDIKEVSFSQHDATYKPSSISKPSKDTVKFTFDQPLKKSDYSQIFISFSGSVSKKMKGFYECKAFQESNKYVVIGATQFEATDARRAFPCFDEPARKATFSLTLTIPDTQTAISNTPIKHETHHDSKKTIEFEETPIMSTYLLAWAIGQFEFKEKILSNNVAIRVYCLPGKLHLTDFALDLASRALPFFEDFFKIPYPLKKLDLVPFAEHPTEAMENWGLLTFDDNLLLIDSTNSSESQKLEAARIISHEIAHQWFGNLVTMEWWTHLWLNEGFASYIENLPIYLCFPEWKVWNFYVGESQNLALELDSLSSSHAIEIEVYDSAQIDEIFDDIAYKKGSSIIRMLAGYLGQDKFKEGLYVYLNKYKYSNTMTNDLWSVFDSVSNKNVTKMMETWTKQKGYPVIQVEDVVENNERFIKLSQRHFQCVGNKSEKSWIVPISYITDLDSEVKYVLLEENSMKIQVPMNMKWIKINENQEGLFRVLYPSSLLQSLKTAVASHTLSAIDRLGLQRDLFALSAFGYISTVEAVNFLSAYEDETDYYVVSDILQNLTELQYTLRGSSIYNKFESFALKLYKKLFQKIGWSNTNLDSLQSRLCGELAEHLSLSGDEEAKQECLKRFQQFAESKVSIEPDLRSAVYKSGVFHGNKETYNTMLKMSDETDFSEERLRRLISLSFTQDLDLLYKTLDMVLNSPYVRTQDGVPIIAAIAENPLGQELAWKFVKDNWEVLHPRYMGAFLLATLIKATVSKFNLKEKAEEVENFFKGQDIAGAEGAIQQAIESIRNRAAQLERDLPDLEKL